MKDLKFKKGTTWYFVNNGRITKCEYLCVFPFKNPTNIGTYDIVIWKDLDNPARIYRKNLLQLIEKNKHIKNYEDAKKELIKQAEDNLKSMKKIYAPKNV